MKLTDQLIKSVSESIEGGLSNIDAAAENDISKAVFYQWIQKAKSTADRPLSKLTPHQKLCRQFKETIDKAKLKRKRFRISKLQDLDNPTGLIFLLKQEHPEEFNKEPVPIPNFKKLEEFMTSEYTQQEIEAIRKVIRTAEARRQSDVKYDENELFGESDE